MAILCMALVRIGGSLGLPLVRRSRKNSAVCRRRQGAKSPSVAEQEQRAWAWLALRLIEGDANVARGLCDIRLPPANVWDVSVPSLNIICGTTL